MSMLKDILSESKEYYLSAKVKLEKKISKLPQGSVKVRDVSGKSYYYLQCRVGRKVMQKYIGKIRPEGILKQIKERKALKAELKKVGEALKILNRAEGRGRG